MGSTTMNGLTALAQAVEGHNITTSMYGEISAAKNPSINQTNDGAKTLTAAGLVDGDIVICTPADDPATLTKEQRADQKLYIAEAKRKGLAADDTTATYYRNANTYDKTMLPNPYEGDDYNVDDDENTGSLIQKRPWDVGAIAAPASIADAVQGETLVDLQVWYDGSDPTTIQNAGVDEEDIEQWNDKSNFAHNANPVGGASAKPLYEASDLKNSHEYVKFDGNDILSVNPFAQLNAAEGWSMFIVANATDISANGGLCATNTGDLKIRIDADGSTSFRSTGNNYAYFGTGTITDDTWHIWSLIYDGTASGNARLIARLDKTSATLYTGTQPAQLSTGSNIMYLGSTNEAGYDLTGYMGEVIMFNRALSATEYANVENYLSNKWDI
jgi:hypothetical protein